MNRTSVISVAAAALLTAASCAKHAGSNALPATTPPPSLAASHVDGQPVITRLVGRDKVITITSSPQGPRYSAATHAGVVIVTGATLEELRQQHPDVYRFVHPATAVEATADNRRSDAKQAPWAGMDGGPLPMPDASAPQAVPLELPILIDASRQQR
jgi:hypothetical protein